MSEQDTFWIKLGQRGFGLLLLVIGIVMLYFTLTSLTELAAFSAFFGLLSVILLALGVVLMISKPPE